MPITTPFLDALKVIEIFSKTKTATALHIGEDAHIQFANDAMLSIWGKDRSVIGKSLQDALPELKDQPFIEMFAKVWREGLTISGADTPAKLNIDGEEQIFYFDFEYKAILDEGGKTICILHSATDVTDRFLKQIAIEKANDHMGFLKREQALNEKLVDKNEDLAAALEELRATNEELQITKESLERLNQNLDARAKEKTETISFLNQELEAFNEEIRASNEELAASNEKLFATNEALSISRDSLAETVERLADSEFKTRNIIESAPFPIGVYTGTEMTIAFANKSITEVWGKGSNVIGRRYAELLPELDKQSVFDQLNEVYRTGIPFEARHQKLDLIVEGEKRTFYFNYNFTALKNELGEIYGVMNTAADVTDLVMAKKQIEKGEQDAIALSHELARTNKEMAAINEELMASNEEMLEFNQHLSLVYEKLKLSQAETALAIDAAAMGTFDLNPDSGTFSANNMLKKWFGLTGDDAIDLEKAIQVIAEEDRDRVKEAIQHSLEFSSGGSFEIDYKIINPKDPEPRIIKAKGRTHFNTDNQPIRLSGVLQDVTEQVTSQEKMQSLIRHLAAGEQKFRRLLQQAPVAINVFKGTELIIESANDRMLEIWNKTADVEGKSFDVALPEIANQPFIKILHNVLKTGIPYHGLESKAVIIRNNLAEERYFNFIYQPIEEEDGKIGSILQVVTEVTEQVNARKEISEINTRLNIAMDAGSLGSTEVDLATGTMKYNEQFKRMFGKKADEEFVYSDMFEAMLPSYRDKIRELVGIAKQNHSIYKGEYEIRWPDGSIHWISAHGRARYDHHGKPVKMVGILSDVTELKADEQRKNDFIGMVSHELKTPLTSLTGYVQLLHSKAQKNGDSFASLALEKANNQLKKMANMINSFLNVSRLESGKIHIERQPFNLSELISEIEADFKVTASSHNLIFNPSEKVSLNADRDKIGHVITNLISNAVKYSPAGTLITIICEIDGSNAKVSVRDQGSGIREADKEKLFERYYRVSDQPQTIAGFGIGLYLCAEIISRHEGKIWVESKLGKGSTFHFSLPL